MNFPIPIWRRGGAHGLPMIAILLGTLAGARADEPPDFVGKRLPNLELRHFHNTDPFNRGSLRGRRWILALVKIGSPNFENFIPLLESTHRPDGGLFVLAFTKEPERQVRSALRKLPKSPTFPVVGDHRFLTHLKLQVAEFPYFYLVDELGKVVWQGPASPKITKLFGDFGKPASSSVSGDTEPRTTGGDLPADYRDQAEAALKDGSTEERLRLLLLAYSGAAPPRQPLLRSLWDRLTGDLQRGARAVERHLDAKRYASARKRILVLRAEFSEFPPAGVLENAWERLAREEGGLWYERALTAQRKGDHDAARKDLDRILRYYGDSEIGAKAAERRKELGDGTELREQHESSHTPLAWGKLGG